MRIKDLGGNIPSIFSGIPSAQIPANNGTDFDLPKIADGRTPAANFQTQRPAFARETADPHAKFAPAPAHQKPKENGVEYRFFSDKR
jgi:hypothetical protein